MQFTWPSSIRFIITFLFIFGITLATNNLVIIGQSIISNAANFQLWRQKQYDQFGYIWSHHCKIIECENYPRRESIFALDTPMPIKLYFENKWNPWRLNDRSYYTLFVSHIPGLSLPEAKVTTPMWYESLSSCQRSQGTLPLQTAGTVGWQAAKIYMAPEISSLDVLCDTHKFNKGNHNICNLTLIKQQIYCIIMPPSYLMWVMMRFIIWIG